MKTAKTSEVYNHIQSLRVVCAKAGKADPYFRSLAHDLFHAANDVERQDWRGVFDLIERAEQALATC